MRYCIPALLAILAITFAACGGGGKPNTAGNKAGGGPKATERATVPADFKIGAKPDGFDPKSAAVLEAGEAVYKGTCLTCHGEAGKGDGAGGAALNPKPTDLTSAEVWADPKFTEEYMFWRIKTGPVGYTGEGTSGMTGFMSGTDEQIWQVVAYVKKLAGK